MLNRVLLIDDSEGEALQVKQQLRDAGFEEPVYWISSGVEAISYLMERDATLDPAECPLPELILLDLGMPDVDGYQFLSWLRRRLDFSRIFVVALTAEMDPKRIRLAYQLGANSFLAKNAGKEEFENFVRFIRGFAGIANRLPAPGAVSNLPTIIPLPPSDSSSTAAGEDQRAAPGPGGP